MAELAAVPSPSTPDDGSAKTKKQRPTKILPTERITHSKQLDLLRAYAAVYATTPKPVTNNDVSEIVNLTASTVSLANAFFADTGLMTRAEGGYVPSADVVNYQRAYQWNKETASHKLAPMISETWFAKALTPRLSFQAMEENEAIATLAEVSAAGREYRPQLKICVDYMVSAGLVQRDGTMLNIVRAGAPTSAAPNGGPMTQTEVKDPPLSKTAAIATTFSTPVEGIVQFNVSVRVNMQEFAGWQPDRIAAFFSGLAQVLAAKGAIEKEASS
ncbi:MAG TPA: hypothetical protein VGV13_14715 [Methylomirabilota bacterium]|jgi:hypothetical protein|nr:hypothetical protein [Methylomirabilota bacterium]